MLKKHWKGTAWVAITVAVWAIVVGNYLGGALLGAVGLLLLTLLAGEPRVDDFPAPLNVPGWPRYRLTDIEHYEKHGTRPKGRAYFGKAKQAHAPDPQAYAPDPALSPVSRDSERTPPKRQPLDPVPERPPDTLTIAELAVALGRGKRTVERLLRDHPEHLPTPLPREDWHRYWAKRDVEAWLSRSQAR